MRAVLKDGDRWAPFFFATWTNRELYYGPLIETGGQYLRVSEHQSGARHVYSAEDDAVFMPEDKVDLQRTILEPVAPLAGFELATERMVTLPKADQLSWRSADLVDSQRRRHAIMEISGLPDPPLWSFRFWLVEPGRLDHVDGILRDREVLGEPVLIEDTSPMLLGFFMAADDFTVRAWMEGVRAMGEPVGVTYWANAYPLGT